MTIKEFYKWDKKIMSKTMTSRFVIMLMDGIILNLSV